MPVAHTGNQRAPRAVGQAMWRGFLGKCPACGRGRMFSSYLKVVHDCPACGEELHHQRADDAPPYFTIAIVGHVVIGALLWVETEYHPEMWVHAAIWIPLTLILSLTLLPRIKGTLVGLQWALYMHGFDPDHVDEFGTTADPVSVESLPRNAARAAPTP